MATKVVNLKGSPIPKEGTAEVAITPGELIERDATDGQFQPHATAAGNAVPMFADINPEIGGGLDDDYAVNQQMKAFVAYSGCEVNALVAASAAAIAIGDYLESAGDGTLRKASSSAATSEAQRAGIVARALEAVDNSSGTVEARIKVEVV